MVEKDVIFSSKIKYNGLFLFKEFYQFCYDWLVDELELDVAEKKYNEKISGNEKEIKVEWEGERKVTDYFKFNVKVEFHVMGMVEVETMQQGKKIKMDKAIMDLKVKGTLMRDYEGKFETTAHKKFVRSVYEKWVIPSRIEQFEEKLITDCDEFLSQAKAYLDLEGKR